MTLSSWRRRTLVLLIAVGACLSVSQGACTSGLFGKGGDCQPCGSASPTDPNSNGCDAGLACVTFTSGSTSKQLCAKPSTKSCAF